MVALTQNKNKAREKILLEAWQINLQGNVKIKEVVVKCCYRENV